MHYQKGFITPFLLIITILLIGTGAYVYLQNKDTNQSATTVNQKSSTIDSQWLSLSADVNGYYKTEADGKVHFHISNTDDCILSGADPSTFLVSIYRSSSTDLGPTQFGKDKSSVYASCKKVTSADPVTYTLLFDPKGEYTGYSKDKAQVYGYFECVGCGGDEPIRGADPSTFQFFSNYFFVKDKNHVYVNGGSLVEDIDSATFVYLGDGYAKDKNNVYSQYSANTPSTPFSGLNIPGADPNTFSLVRGNNAYDAQDKNHKYNKGGPIQ